MTIFLSSIFFLSLQINQPAWGIRLILEALISFLPTPADGAIGALDWTKEERKRLAKESVKFCCAKCGPCLALLPKIKEGSASSAKKPSRFQREIEQLHALQVTHHEKKDDESENEKANEGKAAAAAAAAEASISTNSEVDMAEVEQSSSVEKKNANTEVPESVSKEESQKSPATPIAHETPAASAAGNVATPSDGLATANNAADTAHAAGEASRDQVATQLLQEAEDDIGQNEPTASVTEPAPASAPARQVERIVVPSEEPLAPWFSDPVVHAIIILFAILVALMYRKFTALIDELQSLTNEYASS